ncbi:MAG TPA: Rho termination factor N-terminal domain-containing protein [Solirubrobacterales bacterium]|jgi:hypothetical protein|nr:Rho termination factor N-terminal domain-containing protein [Solirubrobacterales bacterium]
MTKTELESKHLADLHQLAAAAGVERYRMLTRAELIERLSDGDDGDSAGRAGSNGDKDRSGERPRRQRRRSGSGSSSGSKSGGGREREARVDVEDEEEEEAPPRRERPRRSAPAASRDAEEPANDKDSDEDDEGERPRRRRRRRRPFGRRREGISLQDLLLPAESGRQAVLLAESREGATDLLRSVAADLAGSDGPDPVALLIDPSPEELADWKREAPQAELVSAGQARHANDALASAQRRASEGEDVILLVDSLTRFTESFGDTDAAKELFDAGRAKKASGKGSLTVVVALERN